MLLTTALLALQLAGVPAATGGVDQSQSTPASPQEQKAEAQEPPTPAHTGLRALFGDLVEDEKPDTPYEQLEDKTNTDLVRQMMDTLDPREATILRYRFGLDGGGEKTLEEVGKKFGVTRERIRQLQNIALKKLRKRIEDREAVQEVVA